MIITKEMLRFATNGGYKLFGAQAQLRCVRACSSKGHSKGPKDQSSLQKPGSYFDQYKNVYENAGLFQSQGTFRTQQISGDYQKLCHEHSAITQNVNNKEQSVEDDDQDAKAKNYHDMYYKLFNTTEQETETAEADSDGDNNDEYYERYRKLMQGLEDVNQKHLSSNLTHTDEDGQINMVNVGHKPDTSRCAEANGKVILGEKAFGLVKANKLKKGDVLTTAKVAGIMAVKNTSSLIPLCHPIPISKADVQTKLQEHNYSVLISCEVHTLGKTGVEMEALTGVSVAALTVYDMCKAVTHDITISDIKLIHKSGGSRGEYNR